MSTCRALRVGPDTPEIDEHIDILIDVVNDVWAQIMALSPSAIRGIAAVRHARASAVAPLIRRLSFRTPSPYSFNQRLVDSSAGWPHVVVQRFDKSVVDAQAQDTRAVFGPTLFGFAVVPGKERHATANLCEALAL